MRRIAIGVVVVFLLVATSALAQRLTGSIAGQALDPHGNAVPNVRVTISNAERGFRLTFVSQDDGSFGAPDLAPGNYKVEFQKEGFKTYSTVVTVRVGVTTSLVPQLELGAVSTVVNVEASTMTVDTTKSIVQGVITGDRIDSLPLNGRNFLALAALEPGVQLVDGGDFDPTKNQMVGVSVGGRSGRVTRIQVDGVDITDETVGTTVANISNESIQEFGIVQSSLDVSTDLTSSGAVNIITRSGTNQIHGSGFGFFRRSAFAADPRINKGKTITPKPDFSRDDYGGRLGGPFIPDHWFWQADYEQTAQVSQRTTNVVQFPQFSGAFGVPVDERMGSGRTDYVLNNKVSFFYRFQHNDNIGTTGFGDRSLAAFANRNNTNFHVAGADIRAAKWVHSIRYSYVNFNNFIQGANALAGTPLTLDPKGRPVLVSVLGIGGFQVGPNLLAPQDTFQDNKQIKYDGSVIIGRHTFRFGGEYNRIVENGFASFFGQAPRIRASYTSGIATVLFNDTGDAAKNKLDPLNYKLSSVVLGNGLGFSSEKAALGIPFGGFYNNRFGFYFHDTFKWHPNFTVNFGARYVRNDGLDNADQARAPLIALFDPALGATPRTPGLNIGPQAGFAWNLFGNNKWVIRGGGGIYYETNIFNNLFFDRVANIPPGIGNDTPQASKALGTLIVDPRTGGKLFDFSTDCTNIVPGSNNCIGKALGLVIPFAVKAQSLLQAAAASLTANYPPPGVPATWDLNLGGSQQIFDPSYKSPYGAQFNIGIQHEIKSGLVLAADFVMNRGVHFNQIRDFNRLGAADTLNVAAALKAMSDTFSDFGCTAATVSLNVDCVINGTGTTGKKGTISDFAGNGLGSGNAVDEPRTAFGGKNRNFKAVDVIMPAGLSRYYALQVRLTGNVGNKGPFKNITTNITYALGRFKSAGADQDFQAASVFNDRPTAFYGPAAQDRTHQIGVAVQTELPFHFVLAMSNTIKTAQATSIFLPQVSTGSDDVYFTDLNGDGVTEDPLPGTNRGSFSRDVKAGDLNALIKKFNSSVAGTLGPHAQALIQAGLFTADQLTALGATIQPILDSKGNLLQVPAGQLNNPPFITTDIRFSWRYKVAERLTIEPMVECFNLFNVSNFVPLSNTLNDTAGSISGTTAYTNRVGAGTGSFTSGIPRAFQFGIRVSY